MHDERAVSRIWERARLGEALHLLWRVTDRYARQRLALVVAVASAAAVASALTPIALKLAIDGFSVTNDTTRLSAVFLIALYVTGQYLTRCVTELHFLVHGYAQGRLQRNLSLRLFGHLVRLPMRFHLERRTGAVGQVAEQGINACERLLTQATFTVLPVTLEFSAVAIVLLHFGYPSYFCILAFAAVGYAIIYDRGARGLSEPATTMSAARIDAQAALTDNLLNAETIKYYDAEAVVCSRYDHSLSKVESAWRGFAWQRAGTGLGVATVFALSLGASLIYAAYDVSRGAMTVGDFVLINSYIMRFVVPLELLGFALREVVRALADMQGLLSVLREKAESEPLQLPQRSLQGRGQLRFDCVSFAYRPGHAVLTGVTFDVPAGHTLGVVGVSGSGKSSMIRLLFRLYEPDSGQIILDGVPISQMPLSTLRQCISIVPQDTVLFHDTIGNNIAFGRQAASRSEIEEAARVASLHDVIMSMPDAYETLVGERGLKLSGGERQRVAIARAALKRPRIFVFDEATSSLDSRTERDILRNLVSLSSRCTTLVIAHRLSTVMHADEILVVSNGTVIERGKHHELRAHKGYYERLWQAQHGAAAAFNTSAGDVVLR